MPVNPASCFDAIVIGGGPAGLTGAVYLARFRRRVLLIDAGASRAGRIPRTHNHPGCADGIPGSQLLAQLKEQARRYPIEFAVGEVDRLERAGQGWRVHWPGGPDATAHTVLLATGGSDREPSMPHVAEALREGALRYCPVCDGYEVIDQAVGVIAEDDAGVGEALYLRRFTPHLTLFMADGRAALSDEDRRRLDEAGITWVREPTDSIRLWEQRVTVRHGQAETHCDSVYCALGMRIHSQLATALGAQADEQGYLHIDEHHRTSLPGLYAAGDVSRGLNQISVAYGGAAIAASAMHVAMNALEA